MKLKSKVVIAALTLSLMFVAEVNLSAFCVVYANSAMNDGYCRVTMTGGDVCYPIGQGPVCRIPVIQQ